MGLIDRLFGLLFGSGNVVRETAEVFRENADKAAARDIDLRQAAMAQFGKEFGHPRKGWFDQCVDGLNRLPRPLLAFGTIGLFATAMIDPVWFAARMTGIALVPEPLWWLMGAIVSFYFGARHQLKGHEFHRSIAATIARTPDIIAAQSELSQLSPGVAATGHEAETTLATIAPMHNAALLHWRAQRRTTDTSS